MFTALPAKNVTYDAKFGCPEIWYHTRERSINQIHLREAQYTRTRATVDATRVNSVSVRRVDDFIDLRAYLGGRLDFLDKCYGEYSLAKILEYPGQNRLNFVPLVSRLNRYWLYTYIVPGYSRRYWCIYNGSSDSWGSACFLQILVRQKIANGLITIYLDVDYQFLDNVFELRQFTGLIEFEKDQSYTNNVLQIPGATKKIQDIKDQ